MSKFALCTISTDDRDEPLRVRVRAVTRHGQFRVVQLCEPLPAGVYILVEAGDLSPEPVES